MRKAFLIIAASLVLAATAWARGLFPFHDIGSTLSDYADYGPYQRSSAIHGVMGKIDYGVVDVYTWSTSYGNPVNRIIVSETVTICVLRQDYGGAAGFTGTEWESKSGVYWLTGYGAAGTVCHIEMYESGWRR